jgi:hypothetical protein
MVKDKTGQFGMVFLIVGVSPMVGILLLGLLWGKDENVGGSESLVGI